MDGLRSLPRLSPLVLVGFVTVLLLLTLAPLPRPASPGPGPLHGAVPLASPGPIGPAVPIDSSTASTGPAATPRPLLSGTITEWDNLTEIIGRNHPPSLIGAAMVYDPVGQFVLLFGGLAPWGATAYTWAGIGLPGSPNPGFSWVNLTGVIPVSPLPRYYAAMTYDPSLGGVLMFGGQYSGGNLTYADTWLFTGNAGDPQWALLPVGAHPSPRTGAALTFDPLDNYAVLFGGERDPTFYSDTWTFAAGVWTELRPITVPFERAYAGFVFDAAAGYCLLTMGGGGAIDTWSFVHGIWTKLAPATPLGGRTSPSVAYDSNGGNVTVFGGEAPSLTSDYADTWNDSASQVWSQLPTSGPSARAAAAMAYDPFMGFTVLFGGGSDPTGFHNDTWIFGTWPISSAPFSVTIVANPPPALRTELQPGENATVTVYPAGGSWPYHVSVSLIGPNGPHPPNYVLSGSANGSYTVSMRFPSPADYEILANATSGGTGQKGTANLTYPVGTIVLPNWQPVRDAYSFHNFVTTWAGGGNCWGFSTTTILYWEHDIQGLSDTPYLPTPAWATAALHEPGTTADPGLNSTTLAIMVHQTMDPANDVNQGGGFGQSQMAANYAKLLSSLEAGEPSLLTVEAPNIGYHAVVAYGEFTDPLDGIVYILTTDPNAPLSTNVAEYDPTAETFHMVSDGITITAFEVPTSPLPSTLQPSWFGTPSWGNSAWYDHSSDGLYVIASDVPVAIDSSQGGSDSFSDWSGADSQSFIEGIPHSAGIEEPFTYVVNGTPLPGSVQVFGVPSSSTATYSVSDPTANPSLLQVLLAANVSGAPTVRGYDLDISSAGTHHVTLTPSPNGTSIRIGSEAVTMNVTFGQLVGAHIDALNASELSFPRDSIVTFQVQNWSALPSGAHPPVLVRVTTDNGSGASEQYGVSNNQTGLGPGTSLDYALTLQATGLPSGKSWTVTVNGSTQATASSSAGLDLKNGSYPYLVVGPAGERVTGLPSAGTIEVHGAPQTIVFSFTRGATYHLTFDEKGLPRGARWCVSVASWDRCATGLSDAFVNLTAGTYSYALVSPTGGQHITVKVGKSVLGLAGSVVLTKSTKVALRFSYPYRVTFTETGLSSGTWSVTIQGLRLTNGTGDPIFFDLGNGTYGYKIAAVAGYTRLGVPTRAAVVGAPTSIAVTFTSKPHQRLAHFPAAELNSATFRKLSLGRDLRAR